MTKLTKLDIAEYYSDPSVAKKILEQINGKAIVAVQTHPEGNVIRRNNPDGNPIRITSIEPGDVSKKSLRWYTDRRFSEFHPTIGKKTKSIWVDIDPGPSAELSKIKTVVKKVIEHVGKLSEVKSTDIIYSGGRGFHVRGELRRKTKTDDVRAYITDSLKTLDLPDTVFKKPEGSQIRLDTSTLRNKGSLRAAYSLNSNTGRVAVPLTVRELRGFKPEHAVLSRVLSEKEFAPGIPRSRRVYALPAGEKNKDWVMSVQAHNAHRAGKHYDMRLVDPNTGFAHSWALPKSKIPEKDGKPVLAVRTPTHTENYALNFGADGEKEIGKGYGKGTVSIVRKEPIKMDEAKDTSVKFTVGDDNFILFRTKKDNWLLRNITKEKVGSAMNNFKCGYTYGITKLGLAKGIMKQMRTSEQGEPLENNDKHTAAGALASFLQGEDQDKLKREETVHKKDWDRLSMDPEADWGPSMNVSGSGFRLP